MQILRTPGGGAVATLEAAEVPVAEMALLHYLSGPGAECATAADMMRELLFARVEAELREEEAARGGREVVRGTTPPRRGVDHLAFNPQDR